VRTLYHAYAYRAPWNLFNRTMLSRYWHTLRPLSRRQWIWRLRYALERKTGWRRNPRLPEVAPRFNPLVLDRLRQHLAQRASAQGVTLLENAAALRSGKFTYLHASCEVGENLPWRDLSRGRLWLYHLHYFDFARVLAEAQEHAPSTADRDRLLGWIHEWIAANPPGTDVAWDAFCVSARLLNWALAESVFRWEDPLMRRSYEQQVRWLLRHIEWDIRANHLLKNACALTVASQLIGGDAILPGRSLLEVEVQEQVLADGGHVERCPMYHGLVLEDLLIAHTALENKPAYLTQALARMAHWASAMRHPDGDWPLFGDSALGEGLRPAQLLRVAREAGISWESSPAPAQALVDSGYYLASWEGPTAVSRVLIKACGPEPAYQPGHAHADPFTFEYSVSGLRMIVDTGVHGYAESPWRAYCRSVAAHNCATVNDAEPMDAWSVFRVGRRYTPRVESWAVDARGAAHLVGTHDGYAPAVMERDLRMVPGCGMRVCDRARNTTDAHLRSYLHLAPECSVSEEKGMWRIARAGALLWLVPQAGTTAQYHPPQPKPPTGWHFAEFGAGAPAPWFVLSPSRTDDTTIGYALVEADTPQAARSAALKLDTDD
jgi:uncharacterized heparinase superfamily protein